MDIFVLKNDFKFSNTIHYNVYMYVVLFDAPFQYLLSHKDGQPFRDVMKTQVLKLVSMLTGNAQVSL